MCGITGFIGKRVNIEKIKIITIWNDSRGKHSCGLYYDKETFYGVDKFAKMTDFLQVHKFPNKLKDPGFILAHSRSATWGAHSADNAHPITISQGKERWHTNLKKNDPLSTGEDFLLIGVHNGKLHNWMDLRDEAKDVLNAGSFNMDSKVLFGRILIEKEDPKAILESYRGAASVLYTTDGGQTLKVFKGGAGGTEERPLYFLQEPEGYYFSSMAEPLLTIRTTDNKVYNAKVNTLFTFDRKGYVGRVEYDRKKDMDLEEKKYTGAAYSRNSQSSFSEIGEEVDEYTPRGSRGSTAASNDVNHNNAILLKLDKDMKNRDTVGHLMFRDFRYEYRGKNITGRLLLDTNGCVNEKDGRPYWFFEGIMVSEEGFLQIAQKMIETSDDIFELVSMYSRYPIFARSTNDVFRNKTSCGLLTYKGKLFTGNIRPAFFSHGYTVKDGKLVDAKIRKVERNEFYKDQLFYTNTQGTPVQILRDNHGHREVVALEAGEEASDESERASLRTKHILTLASFLGEPVKMKGPIVNNQGSEAALRPDFNIPYQEHDIPYHDRAMQMNQMSFMSLVGPPKQNDVSNQYTQLFNEENEEILGDGIDEFEINEHNWDIGIEDTGFEEVIDDDEEQVLEAATVHDFENKLHDEISDLMEELNATVLKYGHVYTKRKMDSQRAFVMLQAVSDAIELLEKNVGD